MNVAQTKGEYMYILIYQKTAKKNITQYMIADTYQTCFNSMVRSVKTVVSNSQTEYKKKITPFSATVEVENTCRHQWNIYIQIDEDERSLIMKRERQKLQHKLMPVYEAC